VGGGVRWQGAFVVPMVVAAGLVATASAPSSVAEPVASASETSASEPAASTAVGVLPPSPADPLSPVGPVDSPDPGVSPASAGDGFTILGDGPLAIPELVYYAYRAAEMQLAVNSPECALPWNLLAAIGRSTSDHAHGGRTDVLGTLASPATAPDGRVGPMLLPPPVWQEYAVDGNADGTADPQNVFDATLAAGAWMCSVGGPVRDGDGEARAVALFDSSPEFLADTRRWSAAYAKATAVAPAAPVAVPSSAVQPPAATTPGTVDVAATAPAVAPPADPSGGEVAPQDDPPNVPALPEIPAELAELPCLVPGLCE